MACLSVTARKGDRRLLPTSATSLLAACTLLLLCGCRSGSTLPCPTIESEPMLVNVVNAVTGAGVCSAAVVAASNANSYELQLSQSSDSSCSYQLGAAAAGTYAVSASAPGFEAGQQSGVVVAVDSCGLIENTDQITLHLVPIEDAGAVDAAE